MPPTATATIGNTSDVRSEGQNVVTKPKLGTVMRKICTEARAAGVSCTHNQAQAVHGMLLRAVYFNRRFGQPYPLTERELEHPHEVLEVIMSDVVSKHQIVLPKPGTAHELLVQTLLEGNELTIIHTRDGADNCIVAIALH